ncbi:MAG TPA: 6-carboxytetrahydropterin synthase QueD [bacterium]|nr:6-carboxytetrahydropterin synthase QueD [bacterium]HOL47960.1 6-carboxytetrahydropterin synthase QueD [bacterium]HPQ18052.1 6-carboxytetrahydropterin synthase QueD [bacterium]
MFLITKRLKFDAAHNLLNYNGVCENIHGHTYYLEVSCIGKKKEDGMVVDFNIIKKIIEENIIAKFDHKYLNEIIKQPTAENILEFIWKELENKFNNYGVKLFSLKIWEGPNSIAEFRGGADF